MQLVMQRRHRIALQAAHDAEHLAAFLRGGGAICPGWINTPPVANWMKRDKDVARAVLKQTPRGRIGDPDEIAASVLWLCSNAASFAIGTILAIDGGYMA
jgi:NAD(P)-dependent dehydrogenase (short-subunit alcohol dehydrogenase family)